MVNIQSEDRYFFQSGGVTQPYEPAPVNFPGNRVTPLLNAAAYYEKLAETLQQVGNHSNPQENRGDFIYISGFLVNLVYPDDPLTLDTPQGPVRFIDLLIEKARAGVDVRLLIWVSWTLALIGKLGLRPENIDNLRTIRTLRNEPTLAKKVCINLLPHPAGSAHTKLVLVGSSSWAAGFTGGIDLSPDRVAPDWLDVQAKVEGPAVQGFYEFFRELWNQNLTIAKPNRRMRPGQIGRPLRFKTSQGLVDCVTPGTGPLALRNLELPPAGEHVVQSLRTLPKFTFASGPRLPMVNVSAIPGAPKGLFEVKAALEKAFSTAQRYIYIEDQYFWCTEVMQWLNAALRTQAGLRLILVTGHSDQLDGRLADYRNTAFMDGLLPGLTASQKKRISLLQRAGMVHAKTALVDDRWAIIGSTNLACRSLFTDIEHSIAITDPAGQFVREYRARLWGMHWKLSEQDILRITDLEQGLALWDPSHAGSVPAFSPFHDLLCDLPAARPVINKEWQQMVEDPDSRQPWYFPLKAYFKVNGRSHFTVPPGYDQGFKAVSTRG